MAESDRSIPDYWRKPLLILAVSVLVAIALYWDTTSAMAEIWWRSDTYAHGMLIVPLSMWLIWGRWSVIRQFKPAPNVAAALLLLLPGLLWLLADAAGVRVIEQFAFVVMIPVISFALLGWPISRLLLFPLLYLLFAVPAGEGLEPVMIDFTAWFTVRALEWTGLPVYWEGRYITLTSGLFEVAEACSGVRYLIASVALGSLYAHLTYYTLWRQALFMLFAVLVPIIANGIRAFGIVMIAHYSEMQYAVGIDHLIYGWIWFGIVMALLFWLGSLWKEKQAAPAVEIPEPCAMNQGGRGLPIAAGLTLALLVLPPAYAWFARYQEATAAPVTVSLPTTIDTWRQSQAAGGWSPRFVGADMALRSDYIQGDERVSLYMAAYGIQSQDRELINSSNVVFQRDHWLRQSSSDVDITLQDGTQRTVHQVFLRSRKTGGQSVLWYWYSVGNHHLTHPVFTKGMESIERLTAGRPSSVSVLMSAYGLEKKEAISRLTDFLNKALPALDNAVSRQSAKTGE